MSSLRRVVITGIGAITPLANNAPDTWKKLCVGQSGVGKITIFDAETFPTKIAGEVKNFKLSNRFASNSEYEFLGRNSRFALEATREAIEDSGLEKTSFDVSRLGLYFGAGDGGFNFHEYASIVVEAMENEEQSLDVSRYIKLSAEKISSKELREQEPSQVIHHLSKAFGVKGSVSNCLTACAASSQAIGEAFELIRHGHNDVMITGGTHSMIHPLGVAGFNLLTALSINNEDPQKASRPFDKNRDGFVLSEGAAVLILEELEHAKKRGAKIYAEVAGYGGTADAYRMTDPHDKGRGAARAMQLALESAQMKPEDIHYINAHGTSTQLNDQIETYSVKQVFGESAKNIPMSSIKSMLGHMIAAAGAVELIASALTIVHGMIPPTINYQTPDPDCDLDIVPNVARKKDVKNVLSNSFGFGGQNISLIVKRYE